MATTDYCPFSLFFSLLRSHCRRVSAIMSWESLVTSFSLISEPSLVANIEKRDRKTAIGQWYRWQLPLASSINNLAVIYVESFHLRQVTWQDFTNSFRSGTWKWEHTNECNASAHQISPSSSGNSPGLTIDCWHSCDFFITSADNSIPSSFSLLCLRKTT